MPVIGAAVSYSRSPAASDTTGANGNFIPGQLWFDSVAQDLYYLTSLSGGVASWTLISSGVPSVTTLTGNSGGAISPAAGNINIVGGSGTLVAGSGSTLTITAAPQSFTWNDDPASGALAVNNGYIVKTGAKSFSLPATAAVGDEIALMLTGGTSWTITQAAGQSIIVGPNTSTVGVAGSVSTTGAGQTIWLICTTANLTFEALSFVGALSVL